MKRQRSSSATKTAGYWMIVVALLALAASLLAGRFGELSGAALFVKTAPAVPPAMARLAA